MSYDRNPRSNPQRGGGATHRSNQQSSEPIDEIFPEYLKHGYFHGERVRPELLERSRIERLANAMAFGEPPLNSHQIRRFFHHCRRIEVRLRARPMSWDQEVTEFLRIDAFVADARGKAKPKVPYIFEDFIRRNVAAVENERDFKGFMVHFEALLGFGARYFRDRG